MKEEEKRDQIAKQIVMLNPAIGTSLEIIRLLQKHIETKMLLGGAVELMLGALVIPTVQIQLTPQKEEFNLSEEKVLHEFKRAIKESKITPPSLN